MENVRDTKSLDKVYKPKESESRIYEHWEKEGYFKPSGSGSVFSIVIPPPNVTGALHIGHALNITLQDITARYYRMNGSQVLWLPGTDHAGIATQNVVENHLKKQGVSRFDLKREEFVNRVWQWKEEYGGRITSQIRRLGASVDWSHERFTMDEGCAEAVLEAFYQLYKKGYIYRGRYIINWCPRCETALSDIEVIYQEVKGHLWWIRYPFVENPEKGIIVATTRPETMFGDTAVAVHPEDPRYLNLIGKQVILPLTSKHIPIIADPQIDKEFGSGAVKVTPAHDLNDFEMGQRHQLEHVLVMNEKGFMNEQVPTAFQGMDRWTCRKHLIEALEKEGFLHDIKDHVHSRGHCYRCHTVIEPYLSYQWFVAMKEPAKAAIEAVKSKKIQFIPKRWEKMYFDWMNTIRDWCISRQIWWGHRIPVWYCSHCPEPIVAKKLPHQCPQCGNKELTQDPDVLDTWFSSALWPFSTLGWPNSTEDLARYYPTTALITGYDIITFWVSRMITMGLALTEKVPFSHVYIHGLVRDISGKKMSKSLGNVLDPLGAIDEYGADALRFGLASLSTLGGQDIKLSKDKIESCRNFANKIWNVSRYILMSLEEYSGVITVGQQAPISYLGKQPDPLQSQVSNANQWILSQFYTMLAQLNTAYRQFNFSTVCEILWEFSWNVFCDWYIEMSKMDKENSLPTLVFVYMNLLKLLHPLMPFITEEIWGRFLCSPKIAAEESGPLIAAKWPEEQPGQIHSDSDKHMEVIIEVIREIRNLRKQWNIPPSKECDLLLVSSQPLSLSILSGGKDSIRKLSKIKDMDIMETLFEKPHHSSSTVVGDIQIYILLQGLVDIEKEKSRLLQLKSSLEGEIVKNQKKLSNKGFITQAPEDVIEKIRNQQEELLSEKHFIEHQLSQLIM